MRRAAAMRCVAPSLAALLALATTGCDRPAGCYDRSEAHVRIDTTLSAFPPPPQETTLRGVFSTWSATGVVFEERPAPVDGGTYGFTLELEPDARLPDLSEAAVGEVELRVWDIDPDPSRPTEPTFAVSAPGGDRIFILGNGEWAPQDLAWSVVAPRDMNTCTSWQQDSGLRRVKPATISTGTDDLLLLQGEGGTLDGLDITLLSSQSNNRSHPWAPCSTADCPWEKLSWMAVDPSLDLVISDSE